LKHGLASAVALDEQKAIKQLIKDAAALSRAVIDTENRPYR
jgi:hypothetical protein